MFNLPTRACAALILTCIAGCQPMPEIPPPEALAAGATGVAEPFRFFPDAEPLDVAEESADALPLPTVVRLALLHDPAIQKSVARLRQAQIEAKQERLLPNPILDLSYRFPEGGGSGILDAGLSVNLLKVLRQPGLVSAADNRLRAASCDVLVTVLDTVATVRKQYSLAQSLDARVEIGGTRIELTRQLAATARSRVEAGEASRLDSLTLDAELTSLEIDLAQLKGDARAARLTLARQIGSPSSHADWKLDELAGADSRNHEPRSLIDAALLNRPEIQSRLWELRALGEEVRLGRFGGIDEANVGAVAEHDGDWSIGPAISVPIPIFDFGQLRRDQVEARRIEARHDLLETQRKVVEEVRIAATTLSSRQELQAAIESRLIPLQQQRGQQVRDAYKAGLVDITATRLAEKELQESRIKLVELRHQLADAATDLDRAVGGAAVVDRAATTQPSTQGATRE